jgi:hypothetical protein
VDFVRRMVKEELGRFNLNSLMKIRNEVDVMKVEIVSLKEYAERSPNRRKNE